MRPARCLIPPSRWGDGFLARDARLPHGASETCTLNASRGEPSAGQHVVGSIAVTTRGVSADRALERSFSERERIGSRSASAAIEGRVGGWDQYGRPPGSRCSLYEFALAPSDRGVTGPTRHCALGKEPRMEVLNRYLVEGQHDGARPLPSLILPLAPGLACESGRSALRVSVSAGLDQAVRVSPAFHVALSLGKSGGYGPAVSSMREVEGGISSRRHLGDSPINADGPACWRVQRVGQLDDERREPVPAMVLVDANARRGGWQLARPHDGNADPASEHQPTILADGEASQCVIEARQRETLDLESWVPFALESSTARLLPGAHDLLLDDTRALSEPGLIRPPGRQFQVKFGRAEWYAASEVGPLNTTVPDRPSAVPFDQEVTLGNRTWPQTVAKPRLVRHQPSLVHSAMTS